MSEEKEIKNECNILVQEMVDKQVAQYLILKTEAEAIKAKMDFLKSSIMIELEGQGLTYLETSSGADVGVKEQTRKSLNKKLVEENMVPKVFLECFKETTFNVVSIRSKERREQLKAFKK